MTKNMPKLQIIIPPNRNKFDNAAGVKKMLESALKAWSPKHNG
jgi:hypothetical protein